MSALWGLGRLDGWVERGWIPDSLVRWAIRRILQDRLRLEQRKAGEAQGSPAAYFTSRMSDSPIAVGVGDANSQHYEVPPAFFETVLGRHLKYSCGYWDDQVGDLHEAEARMLSLTCERAQIRDGQNILELGCGWGSLSLWMAERYPGSSITAVSNSKDQRKFIEDACSQRGLKNLKVLTADMNTFEAEGAYDRVVSVEMFEHMRNWGRLISRIAGWLKPGGKFFLHVFAHQSYPYMFEDQGDEDWMARHFFTGGLMPSIDLPLLFQSELQVEDQWQMTGDHYARTADAWLANLDAQRSRVIEILGVERDRRDAWRWLFRWRIFFLACAELWGFRKGSEWGVGHYLYVKK